jgi:DnaJ-like protein
MLLFELIAEQKLEEAVRAGQLDNLPGAGKPLDLDDDALIAPELRMAHRVLKNAGLLPPEVELRREITDLHALLATLDDDAARRQALTRLALLELRLESSGRARLGRDSVYNGRILRRFGVR